MKTPRLLSLVLLTGFAATTALTASDWPQWRGANRDGIVAGGVGNLEALPKNPQALWRIRVGGGHAAPVISGDKLIYLDDKGGKETAHQISIKTGKEIWSQVYDADPAEYSNFGTGPRCAPLIDGDRVYVQSGRGKVKCLSMKDGSVIWGVDFEKDFGATWFGNRSKDPEARQTAARRHGNNGSPIIVGDRIFLPVGDPDGATLAAFNKLTGKKLWQTGKDYSAYSSLMAGNLAGVPHVIHYNADALTGVHAEKGATMWRIPIKTGAKRHTVTPILDGDTVWVSSHSEGMIKVKAVANGRIAKVKEEWRNKNVKTMLATPVLIDGNLFGLGTTRGKKTDFVCVDFATGAEKWNKPGAMADYASLIAIGDKILALNSNGKLSLLRANPNKFEQLGSLQVCGETWCFPAYVDGVLYVRDGRQLVALKLTDVSL